MFPRITYLRGTQLGSLLQILAALYLKNDDFFDEVSKIVYNQIPKTNSSIHSRVMLNIERFEIGQSYVTAKVENIMSVLIYRAVDLE